MRDVIVVGGGPAGAAAAIHCARAGLDVVLLERQSHCVDKPGETLHPGVEPIFDQLGVGDLMRSAGFLRHEGVEIVRGGESRRERYGAGSAGPWRGFQAWRATMEAILLEAAQQRGVVVHRGIHARHVKGEGGLPSVHTDRGSFRTRWLVDATGGVHWAARRLRRRLEHLGRKMICWYGYVERRSGEWPRFEWDETGWTWTAEVKPRVYQWTQLTLDGRRPSAIPIAGEPIGRGRAADVTWRWIPDCAWPGYFMVGDAAAVFDPMSSHGVLRALMTGIFAGDLIVACAQRRLSAPLACHRYRQWLGRWIHHEAGMMEQFYQGIASAPVSGKTNEEALHVRC